MWRTFIKRRNSKGNAREILPDEIFLDSSNLPEFDSGQFEGRVESPVSNISIFAVAAMFIVFGIAFMFRSYDLQIVQGASLDEISKNNRLEHTVVFSERGVIFDRNGKELAWNEAGEKEFSERRYINLVGLSHLLGFVRYPKTDKSGEWWRTEVVGAAGVEQAFNDTLASQNGQQIVEINALGEITRGQLIYPSKDGRNIILSIDSEVQSELYSLLSNHANIYGFKGGASVIMDVETGEIIAMVSFPEYDSQILTNGTYSVISNYTSDTRNPFLNRVVQGAYTPGSIVKPLFAAAALAENIIKPDDQILSTGSISLPNPFVPGSYSVFPDWKAHGLVNMKRAIAVSSNVYFFIIGGGFEGRIGLGIERIEKWARAFGLGKKTGIPLFGEVTGTIPSPKWKAENFEGDEWRIGDTYNTSIGQYGFQITPIQAVRATAAIANGGTLLLPRLVKGANPDPTLIGVSPDDIKVVRDGMRMAVKSPDGTARALNILGISIAGKTGTAQIGIDNQWMHSWAIGFWPTSNPKYAFATVLEQAPDGTLAGSAPAMRPFFEWLVWNKGEYVE
jgi:penicillin-binding protein 2